MTRRARRQPGRACRWEGQLPRATRFIVDRRRWQLPQHGRHLYRLEVGVFARPAQPIRGGSEVRRESDHELVHRHGKDHSLKAPAASFTGLGRVGAGRADRAPRRGLTEGPASTASSHSSWPKVLQSGQLRTLTAIRLVICVLGQKTPRSFNVVGGSVSAQAAASFLQPAVFRELFPEIEGPLDHENPGWCSAPHPIQKSPSPSGR